MLLSITCFSHRRRLLRKKSSPTSSKSIGPKARGVNLGCKPKLTDHQKREAIKRRDHGVETLAEIGRSYNVSGWTIARPESPREAANFALLTEIRQVHMAH